MIEEINTVIEEIRLMLIEKNRAYGNSAIEPVRIFSRSDPVEQLKVRIDDKIARVMKGHELSGEATIDDLIGYLVLLKIARRIESRSEAEELRSAYGPEGAPGQIYPYQQPAEPPYPYDSPPYQAPPPRPGGPAEALKDLQDGLDNYYGDRRVR